MDTIPENRPLTDEERSLVDWLLNHGIARAKDFVPQLDCARVVSRCGCGCASIDFAIDGVAPAHGLPIGVLSDFEWTGPHGELFGVFVFVRGGLLAGLEVWSQDGLANAELLPSIDSLHPIGEIGLTSGNGELGQT
jgi:hypothetical protein